MNLRDPLTYSAAYILAAASGGALFVAASDPWYFILFFGGMIGCVGVLSVRGAVAVAAARAEGVASVPRPPLVPAPVRQVLPGEIDEVLRDLATALDQAGHATASALNFGFALREDIAGLAEHHHAVKEDSARLRRELDRAVAARTALSSELSAWVGGRDAADEWGTRPERRQEAFASLEEDLRASVSESHPYPEGDGGDRQHAPGVAQEPV